MRVLSIFSILAGISAFPGNGTTSRHLRKASRRLIWDDDEGAGGTSFGERDPSDPWADVWAPEADFHGSDHVAAQNGWGWGHLGSFHFGKLFSQLVKEKAEKAASPLLVELDSAVREYSDWSSSCAGSWLGLMTGCVPILGTAHGSFNMAISIAKAQVEDKCKFDATTGGRTVICQDTDAVLQLAGGGVGDAAPLVKPGAVQNFMAGTGQVACAYGTMKTLMQIAKTCKSGPGVQPKRWQPTCDEMILGYHAFERNNIEIPPGSLYTKTFLKLVDRPGMLCSLSKATKTRMGNSGQRQIIEGKLSVNGGRDHVCANKLIYIATQKRDGRMYRELPAGGRQRRLSADFVLSAAPNSWQWKQRLAMVTFAHQHALEKARHEELKMTDHLYSMCTAASARRKDRESIDFFYGDCNVSPVPKHCYT